MNERTTKVALSASPTWEELEGWVRVQIQELLKQEVTELLGRARYQRRAPVDGAQGYRDGYGKPRKLTPGGVPTKTRVRVLVGCPWDHHHPSPSGAGVGGTV